MIEKYLKDNLFPAVQHYIPGILIFLIGWWIINRISKLSVVFLNKVSTDSGVVTFLNSVLKFSLRIIIALIAISNMGFNVDSIVTALGASLVAIGISLKDSLSNIVSGIVLLVNKPIHVGDFIEFDGSSGKVMKIEMLFTTLRANENGKTVIIPNSRLISNTVVRKSEYDVVSIEKNYKIPNEFFEIKGNMKKFLEKEFILSSVILQIPKPEIIFEDESEKVLNLKIKIWFQGRHAKKAEETLEKIILKLFKRCSIESQSNMA